MTHTIISTPTIPDHLRRYKPENRVVLTLPQMEDELRRTVREARWQPRLVADDWVQEAALARYTELYEAFRDAADREQVLRTAIVQLLVKYDMPNRLTRQGEAILDALWGALDRCYTQEDADNGFQWVDPETSGPPRAVVFDAEAQEATANG